MRFYIVLNSNFTWSLLCTSDMKNSLFGDECYYKEIDYNEFIYNLDFCKGAIK